MSLLSVREIECRFRDHSVVRNLAFDIAPGELVGLLGPSGCGKTTVLRAIAGFHPLYRGRIDLHGRTVSRPGYTLSPERRRLGMMFQDYALFPHITVGRNVSFGLRSASAREERRIAEQMLAMVGLVGFSKRYPHELSGGQQQRVALARALAPRPDLLLMDEPFSSLDVELRERLSLEVRDILRQQGITGIVVTHNQDEAFAMCEKIGVMVDGAILQWNTPYAIYHEPACRFIAEFVGKGTFLPGTALGAHRLQTELGIVQAQRSFGWPPGTAVDVLFRPDDVLAEPQSPLRARVVDKAFRGAETLYRVRLPTGGELLTLFPSHHNHEVGDTVGITIEVRHIIAFSRHDSGTAQGGRSPSFLPAPAARKAHGQP